MRIFRDSRTTQWERRPSTTRFRRHAIWTDRLSALIGIPSGCGHRSAKLTSRRDQRRMQIHLCCKVSDGRGKSIAPLEGGVTMPSDLVSPKDPQLLARSAGYAADPRAATRTRPSGEAQQAHRASSRSRKRDSAVPLRADHAGWQGVARPHPPRYRPPLCHAPD